MKTLADYIRTNKLLRSFLLGLIGMTFVSVLGVVVFFTFVFMVGYWGGWGFAGFCFIIGTLLMWWGMYNHEDC